MPHPGHTLSPQFSCALVEQYDQLNQSKYCFWALFRINDTCLAIEFKIQLSVRVYFNHTASLYKSGSRIR